MVAFRTIIMRALFLLVFSIFLTALAAVFILMNGNIRLYVVTVLLLFVFSLLYFFYKEVPESKLIDDENKFIHEIKEWLDKRNGESGPRPDSTPT